jgi:16S rRNA G966 N2-methylase RsmD
MLPALAALGAGLGWLSEDAVTVAKHFWRDELPERIGMLQRTRERRFGETMLSFYETAGAAREDVES